MSLAWDLANSVKTVVAAVTGPLVATVPANLVLIPSTTRSFLPTFDLESLDTLRLTVAPKSMNVTNASRSKQYFDISIDVGVQYKIDPSDATAMAGMVDYVQRIVDALRGDAIGDAYFVSIENDPIYWPKVLNEQRVFVSVVTVTYRVLR